MHMQKIIILDLFRLNTFNFWVSEMRNMWSYTRPNAIQFKKGRYEDKNLSLLF